MAEQKTFDARAYAETMAHALNLPLDCSNPEEVAKNLALAFRLAPLFLDFPLDDEAEPGPVFNAFEVQS
jgi:hypothetical protein